MVYLTGVCRRVAGLGPTVIVFEQEQYSNRNSSDSLDPWNLLQVVI